MAMHLLVAAAKPTSAPLQWWTLAWIAGAAVAATVIITVIVVVSRRPKSMEDGMADFSRSLQAVAPTHRYGARGPGEVRPSPSKPAEPRSVRATRGESETV
jgi:hypothetical protein